MKNIITTDKQGRHVFDYTQLTYHQYKDYRMDKELRSAIWSVIEQEGRDGNHVWVLKAPPAQKPDYHQPDIYIPEWQFTTALDVISSVYEEWTEKHAAEDTTSPKLRADYEGKAEFDPYDYRRWEKVDDERMGFNFSLADNDLDMWGEHNDNYIDYDYRFYYETPADLSDGLFCALIRSALKDNLSRAVVAYFREEFDGGWPYEILWLSEQEIFKKYPDIKEYAVNNGYAE